MTNQDNEIQELQKEADLETTLRPKFIEEFNGQKNIIDNLKIIVKAAKQRSEPLDHVLFYGPPGLGKTTLAHIIANEYQSSIKMTSGPVLERSGDLASILTNLEEGDILFIDEIHRLNKNVEEAIYPALEDFGLDIILGKGPSARTVRLDLPKFTLVGATTKVGSISNPLRDRFGAIFKLDFYSPEELMKIIVRSATILNMEIDAESVKIIALRSRGTPRIANKLLKRVRDYSQVAGVSKIMTKHVNEIMGKIGVNEHGLDSEDLKYLETIEKKFDGGPVGLTTLAAALSEDVDTIENVIEPFLLQRGLIKRTSKGRVLTHMPKSKS